MTFLIIQEIHDDSLYYHLQEIKWTEMDKFKLYLGNFKIIAK